jgi:hypothetical protein
MKSNPASDVMRSLMVLALAAAAPLAFTACGADESSNTDDDNGGGGGGGGGGTTDCSRDSDCDSGEFCDLSSSKELDEACFQGCVTECDGDFECAQGCVLNSCYDGDCASDFCADSCNLECAGDAACQSECESICATECPGLVAGGGEEEEEEGTGGEDGGGNVGGGGGGGGEEEAAPGVCRPVPVDEEEEDVEEEEEEEEEEAAIDWTGTWSVEATYNSTCENGRRADHNHRRTAVISADGNSFAADFSLVETRQYIMTGPGSATRLTLSGPFPALSYDDDLVSESPLGGTNNITFVLDEIVDNNTVRGTMEGNFSGTNLDCVIDDGATVEFTR